MEWEVAIVELRDQGKLAEFESGRVFEMNTVEIRDHQTFERIYVKAQLCKDPAKLPDSDVLWVRGYKEEIFPESARIKILEKLPTPDTDYR